MAGLFSDSDEDKAVDELLSQAMDSTVLEQVAAINCSGFNNSGLPSHLETRFARLKSFPSATAKPSSLSTKSFRVPHPSEVKGTESPVEAKKSDSIEGFSPISKEKSAESKNCASCPYDGLGISELEKNPRIGTREMGTKSNSPDSWEGLSSRSVSPPVRTGCFMCSPKKSSRKKNKKNRGLDLGLDWGKHDELLSDLSSFSVHSQKKMIREAMEEEEKICKEAEKIVKWAKQASARMDVSNIEDILSDDEKPKFL